MTKNETEKQQEMDIQDLESIDLRTQYRAAGAIIYTERLLWVLRVIIFVFLASVAIWTGFYVLVELEGYIWVLDLWRGKP